MRTVLRFRLLGVAFLVLMLVGVYLTYAVFAQKFTSFTKVDVNTDTIGLQLPSQADVKVRGEIVGQVLDTRTRPGGAVIQLGLDPDKVGSIPQNVSAALLPKTLFGEKYVSLNIPSDPSSSALKGGDLIKQTKLPIEVEKVLNDIYPLLRTVQPAELNYTLNALATALEGRGDELGNSLEVLNRYLIKMNPKVPQLIDDLKLLSTVSDTYADVTPELGQILRNTVKTGNTLLGRQARLHAFLKDTTSFSNTTRRFLDDNGDNLIALGRVSEPTLSLLRSYSPEFPCLLGGLVGQAPKLAQAFRDSTLHIVLRTLPQQPRAYTPGDQPVFGARNAPYCGTLPNPPYSPGNVKSDIPDFDDGVAGQLSRTSTNYSAAPSALVGGTDQEKAMVKSVAAPVLGVPADQVGDLSTLLFAPLARGTEVSTK